MAGTFSMHRQVILGAGIGLVVAGIGLVAASDHQDTPLVELNPAMDMSDVYAFPSPTAGRIVLVLNSRPVLTPAQTASAGFDTNLLYQFKFDSNGDAVEDQVIQVTFTGTGASQQVHVRGPVVPSVKGSMMNELAGAETLTGATRANLGSSTGMQVFAGPRDDPFFIDLEQFFRIIPDRKPVTGSLSQLPNSPTATGFRPASQAVDFLSGLNVLSIVIELPVADLTLGGSGRLGIWGTISR